MEDVVAAARRIKKIMEEQADTKMEWLVNSMQEQICILAKDFRNAHEQNVALKASPPPTTAIAAKPAATATSQAPPVAPARHIYQDYGDEAAFSRLPRCQLVRHPSRCFFCGEEGHFIANTPPVWNYSASFAGKPTPTPARRHEDRFWSYPQLKTTLAKALTYR